MTRDTTENKQSNRTDDSVLFNPVTIVERGVLSNFEISVSGEIEMVAEDPVEQAIVVSGGVAEGSIETGVQVSGSPVRVRLSEQWIRTVFRHRSQRVRQPFTSMTASLTGKQILDNSFPLTCCLICSRRNASRIVVLRD